MTSQVEPVIAEAGVLSGRSSVISNPAGVVRIHYLDNLRALAMFLGVFLHAAFAYAKPSQSFWLATDAGSSVLIDGAIWFIHLFRMNLFFLLSGYFGAVTVERKGIRSFAGSRTVRIVLPFLLSYPFLLGAMTAIIVFAMSYLREPKGLLGIIVDSRNQSQGPSDSPWTTMHLWFLYYLFLFSMAACVLSRWNRFTFGFLFSRPRVLLVLPLLLVPGIWIAGTPVPSPESFVPAFWPFMTYGLFYFLGWQLKGRESFLDELSPYITLLIAGSAFLYCLYYWLMPNMDLSALDLTEPRQISWQHGISCLLTAYLSIWLTLVAMLLGKTCLEAQSPFLRLVADSSYWTYLTHLPVVMLLQTLLIEVSMSVWIKLPIVIAMSGLFCTATYLVFVRYTHVGWLLNGKRPFP